MPAMMPNLAVESAGAQVVMSTSMDEKHMPEDMLDGSERTFWSTTGLYPQEFIISLGASATISEVQLWSTGIASLSVEKTESNGLGGFEPLFNAVVEPAEGQLQEIVQKLNGPAVRHVKFIILDGHSNFVTVHKVYIHGEVIN